MAKLLFGSEEIEVVPADECATPSKLVFNLESGSWAASLGNGKDPEAILSSGGATFNWGGKQLHINRILSDGFPGSNTYAVRLRASSDNLLDFAKNTWTGVSSSTPTKFSSYSINASNTNATLSRPIILKADEDWTISFWVYRTGDGRWTMSLCGEADGYSESCIYLRDYSCNATCVRNNSVNIYYDFIHTNAVTPINQWSHVCYINDATNHKQYLGQNGEITGSYNGNVYFVLDRIGITYGGANTMTHPGYFDDICVIRGKALWTGLGTYEVPTTYL